MAKKSRAIRTFKYKDWNLDSQGEVDFCYYLEELEKAGYIEDFKRGMSYCLSNSLVNTYKTTSKKGIIQKSQTILSSHVYTPDFQIYWTKEGRKLFTYTLGENKITKPFILDWTEYSIIENKPAFDFANMTRLSSLNIKWMWDKYGIYVQKIVNDELFAKTFTPKACLKTKTGKDRKIKWEVRTLEEYVKSISNE